jgi:hypothetical protein
MFPTGSILKAGSHLDQSLVETLVFVAFMMMSILFAVAIFGLKNTFKQSDVDVLFPTPVSSKSVMFFRLCRDYALTLFFPVILSLFTFKPAMGIFNEVKRSDPEALNIIIRGGIIGWLLMALAWISISYALSFFIAKYEKWNTLIVQVVGWSIFLVIALTFTYIGMQLQTSPSVATLSTATSVPWLRGLMFLPTAATAVVMGGLKGSLMYSLGGGAVFIAVTAGCLSYSAKMSGWMYDQAATKGFQGQAIKDFQRKGDYTSIVAEKARQGRVGKGRIAKRVANWNFRKGWTLIYKEILIQARIGFWLNFLFLLLIAAFGIMFLLIPDVKFGPYLYLAMTGFMAVNMSSVQSYSGFVETLRRVEVMKPLPLTSAQIAFFETAAKAVVAMFMSFTPFLVGLIYRPTLWQYHLAGMISAPSLSLALVSAVFLIVVLFPDFDDPTQRSFRGIMQLIALMVILVPTGLIFVGNAYLGLSPLVAASVSLALNIGITAILSTVAGHFYADFNPSE